MANVLRQYLDQYEDPRQRNALAQLLGADVGPPSPDSSLGIPNDSRIAGRDGGPNFGDLDHELAPYADRPQTPQDKMMQDALMAKQGDQNAFLRIQRAIEGGQGADTYGALPKGNNFVKNETTGLVTYLPDRGSAQSSQSQGPKVSRVYGSGNGTTVDLGDAKTNETTRPELASGRNPIDIPGVGRGFYGKDNNAYVPNSDGTWTKVILGYDQGASMALNDYHMKQAAAQAGIDHLREEIAASQATRNQKEGIPGMGIPQSVLEKQFGKAPEGKRWDSSGQLEDIPGAGPGKLTESQGKATGLATRAQAAHDILTGFEGQGVTTPSLVKQAAESVPLVGGALAMGVNKLGIPSDAQNQVEQAQRDFVNAALRVESGASISQGEFDNARKQYFPQPGDSQAVIQAKQQAREREINALSLQSGSGASAIAKVKAADAPAKVSDNATRAKTLFDAKRAIAMGAPAAQVRARLASMGITDQGV